MSEDVEVALKELATSAADNCLKLGAAHVQGMQAAAHPLLLWLDYLEKSQLTGHANVLVEGARSAVNEGAACLSLGLVRSAIMSIRLQIDLALAWVYFKDHHVEWGRVQATGDGFKTKKDLLDYFKEHAGFSTRFGLLKECITRAEVEPYRLLSAHIHAQSEYVVPRVAAPCDIVASPTLQADVIKLQRETSEYISDVYWSLYAEKWPSLPPLLRDQLDARFKTPAQKKTFWS